MVKATFFRWLIFFAVFSFLIGGCSPKPQRKPLQPSLKIAVAVSDLQWDGMQVMRKVMEKRGKSERVDVTWLDAGNDPREQERQIEQLLKKTGRQRVKVVVLQPVDPRQSPPLVEKLTRAKVKVLALERLVSNVPLDGYLASDHFLAGQLQARYVMNLASLQKPFNALILKGDPADPAAQEIAGGIRGSLNENVQILKELDHFRNDQSVATLNVRQALQENKIDVIFATDSRLAAGAVTALKSVGLTDQVITTGVGADKSAARALIAGEHDAEVDIMPELMGQYILDAAVSLAKTGHWQYDTRVDNGNYSVPAKITPVRLVDKTNAYLLEQRWGEALRKEGKQDPGQGRGKGSAGGNPEGEGEGSREKQGGGGEQPEGGQQKAKTMLRITTQEGKTIEVEIPGEIKRIESSRRGRAEQAGQEGAGGA